MVTWHLGQQEIEELTRLPETGMGFQLVESVILGKNTPLLIMNSETAIDLSALGITTSDNPGTILRNGLRIMEVVNSGVILTNFSAPAPRSFRLLSSRIPKARSVSGTPVTAFLATAPSSLVKHVTLTTNRRFHRYSAFCPDRRVDPVTGNFLPGTYAAPDSEVPYVPTGFVAVGRFALPNTLPASYHYQIEAPAGTAVDFGTVTPAFGQAGGGVEAYFRDAVANAMAPPAPVTKSPDE